MSDSLSPSAQSRGYGLLLSFAALYFLVWVCVPPLVSHSFALDVTESLSWGQEWQWGYYKHPPLAPIVLNLFYEVFGTWGPYLLSQLCIAATLWMVWRTGRRMLDRQRALIGTVLTMGVTYYSFPTIEFNHNIAQMPLWAALVCAFLAALQDGKLWQWAVLGVLAGLAMLTKYPMAIVLLTCGLYLLLSKPRRALLWSAGPWLALGLLVVVFAPHLLWLQATDGLPFAYASERALAQSGNPRLQALLFPVTQLLTHLPLLLALVWAMWRTRHVSVKDGQVFRWHLHCTEPLFLWVFALAPVVIVTAMGVLMGARLRDMWGSPMWALSGLLCAALLPTARLSAMQPKVLRAIAVWLTLVSVFLMVYVSFGAQLRKRAARMDWPAVAMAAQADQTWQQLASCPLDTVAGDYWLVGILSAHGQTRPSVLIDTDPKFSPWITPQRLQSQGALWVWQSGQQPKAPPEPLASVAQQAAMPIHEGTWQIPWPYDPKAKPLTLHWRAYVPHTCAR